MAVQPFPTPSAVETPEVRETREALERFEAAIDAAIHAGSLLLATGVPVRQRLKLSPVHGMKAERQVTESLLHLADAKGLALAAHAETLKTARRAGLVVAVGPVDKPDEDGPRDGDG